MYKKKHTKKIATQWNTHEQAKNIYKNYKWNNPKRWINTNCKRSPNNPSAISNIRLDTFAKLTKIYVSNLKSQNVYICLNSRINMLNNKWMALYQLVVTFNFLNHSHCKLSIYFAEIFIICEALLWEAALFHKVFKLLFILFL